MGRDTVQAAYLTHELRAPVTSIRLGLELLQDQTGERLDGDERRMLEAALRNAKRLEGLVDDIMDYSKAAAGRMPLAPAPCEPRALLDEAADAMRACALSKAVRLAKDCDPLLAPCAAEGRRVVQVLVNLVSNAVKFTPRGGAVTLAAREGAREHAGTILFKVKDTGPGVAAADRDRIFGLFEQLPAGPRSGGTGLGLTLSKALVELHGGRIWAESWPGCGATFCFTIPVWRPGGSPARPAYGGEDARFHGLLADAARRLSSFVAFFA